MRPIGSILLACRTTPSALWAMVVIIAVAAIARHDGTAARDDTLSMWLFSPEHKIMYAPIADSVRGDGHPALDMTIMSRAAIKSRTMSGFLAGLPTADIIEIERGVVGSVFMGPEESVGLVNLSEALDDSTLAQFNEASLVPWSAHGNVYGLPHDVHPVLLAYRADITEAAGIDLQQAETWDEFFAMLAPLAPDHAALGFWYTQPDNIELLILQAGGAFFDASGAPTIDHDTNVAALAEIVSWCVRGDAVDIDEFSAAGHRARVRGDALAYLTPDWMCSIWRVHVPKLSGTMKLMPLPAFEPGGRRTSVRGGTMVGFPKTSAHFNDALEIVRELYTSPDVARELYTTLDIITPVKSLWDDPVYDAPDPFFMGQPKGRLYIDQAPHIPARSSSPYTQAALFETRDAAIALARWAQREGVGDPADMEPKARELLERAQLRVLERMERNAFAPGAAS